jgi:exodeoxyribonuclease VII large subunit
VRIHQLAREMRATTSRGVAERTDYQSRVAGKVFVRKIDALTAGTEGERTRLSRRANHLERAERLLSDRRARALAAHAAALRAHDPERTLERGYALALDGDGEPLADADALRAAGDFDLRMAGGTVAARVHEEQP